jgi:predicted transcriptional regulator
MIGNTCVKKQMQKLEKIIFIDLTCLQIGKPVSEHPEFIETWENLSQTEKDEYIKLSAEIHEIWTYINLPKQIVTNLTKVNSVNEYNEQIKPVNNLLLTICKDFDITLKEELTADFLKTVKRIMGKDFLTWYEI